MNKLLICLIAALTSTASVLPVLAQDVASVEVDPVFIAPPQTPLAQTIKKGLTATYYDATKDSTAYAEAQKLYFFYGARHFEPIWLNEAAAGQVAFSALAEKILKLFAAAANEGLRPQDYLTSDLDVTDVGSDPVRIAALEIAFSRATMRYATHIYTGRIVPSSVSQSIDIAPKKLDEAGLLAQLASSPDPVKVLATLEPIYPEFLALKAALTNFDQTQTDRPMQIRAGAILHPGMSDTRVPVLRQRFELADAANTLYDDNVVEAIKAFQRTRNLAVDGVMGPATLAELNGGAPLTKADILANMERWRWMSRDLGAFNVLVNIPEFRLSINRDSKEEYTTRVVVGAIGHQTPIFSDNIRHIVVNPYWNVPNSIIKNEIAPAVLRNPDYINSHNYDLLYNGSPVSTGSVDWNQISASNFPFRVRQRPGTSNALGQIKFLFPNKHDVYLHDTPSKSLFARDSRALSHGCVRVQNPMEFAGALMINETKISRSSLEGMLGTAERQVNLEHQIPVHIAYFTVRVAPDGTLRSFGDIYGHNAKLIAAMGLDSPASVLEMVAAADDGTISP
ncbi:MAG: L,D-transpeptidase family protein [Candidatus Devosia symbiotica]|nr:L,D-transpeptidase family protein [Candidatus Devosia symbiotica]